MKFYRIPISPNCRKAEATIYFLDLKVEIITKDIMGGELDKDDYREINPNSKVPALVDGDYKLWESNAIMQYLADKANAETFFPTPIKERTDMVRWQFWGALHYNRAVGSICWETVAKPAMNIGETNQAAVDAAMEDFNRFATVLERQLDKTLYVCGKEPSIADFSVGDHSAMALKTGSQVPLDNYPNIKNWYEMLEKIPAWAKTNPNF